MESSEAHHLQVAAIVTEAFQLLLGTAEAVPLESRLVDDLGLDSIMFIVTLLDLSDQLGLDLGTAPIDMNAIQTLGDVVSLVQQLGSRGPAAG